MRNDDPMYVRQLESALEAAELEIKGLEDELRKAVLLQRDHYPKKLDAMHSIFNGVDRRDNTKRVEHCLTRDIDDLDARR